MATYNTKGDAIRGDKIIGTARRVDGPTLVRGSGNHRTNQVELRRDAFAVIAMPLKAIPKAKKRSKTPNRRRR